MATNPNAYAHVWNSPSHCGKITGVQHQRERPRADHSRKQASGCLHHSRSTSLPSAHSRATVCNPSPNTRTDA
ncbi:hypothetical protein IG631_03813 [Alternaria alternata]|nr:hypothetical protein IG631_03813 [Alternaria alternata]